MSITKILSNKETTAAEKLTAVSDIISKVREAYGNADVVIEAPKVNTAYGYTIFIHLEDDSKVEVLRDQVMKVKAEAIAYTEMYEGTVLNKKVEELLATNPYFANVGQSSNIDYL